MSSSFVAIVAPLCRPFRKVAVHTTPMTDLLAVTWLPCLGHLTYSLHLYSLQPVDSCRLYNLNCLVEFEAGLCLEYLLSCFVLEPAHNMILQTLIQEVPYFTFVWQPSSATESVTDSSNRWVRLWNQNFSKITNSCGQTGSWVCVCAIYVFVCKCLLIYRYIGKLFASRFLKRTLVRPPIMLMK